MARACSCVRAVGVARAAGRAQELPLQLRQQWQEVGEAVVPADAPHVPGLAGSCASPAH